MPLDHYSVTVYILAEVWLLKNSSLKRSKMSMEVTGGETKKVNILQLLYATILVFAKSTQPFSSNEDIIWFHSPVTLDLTTLFDSLSSYCSVFLQSPLSRPFQQIYIFEFPHKLNEP